MKRLASLILLLCALTLSAQQGLIGTWNGELKVMNQTLPIVFHFADSAGVLTATVDSPFQGAEGIEATPTFDGLILTVIIPSIRAKFAGALIDDELRGDFEQSGFKFPLSLKPGPYIPPRPQTPRPPFPYQQAEVTFTNPLDSAVLSGTLTLPVQYYSRGAAKVPVVVMVSGSGLQNRDEEIAGHKPFALLAHHLALAGVASLRYDDRGTGSSTGAVDNATTATFAADAKAAVDYLRALPSQFKSVGVLGHSEGGTIAYTLAADGDADFIVSLAGPAQRGDSVLLYQNEKMLRLAGADKPTTSGYIEALARVLQFMQAHPHAKAWEGEEPIMAGNPALDANLHAAVATRNPWLDHFIATSPASAVSAIHCPVLAISGSLDSQVDPQANTDTLRQLLPANPANEIVILPGLNHLLQTATTGAVDEYLSIEETISPTALNKIVKWIKSL